MNKKSSSKIIVLASICIAMKLFTAISFLTDYYLAFIFKTEYINYILNAALFLCGFWAIEKKLKKYRYKLVNLLLSSYLFIIHLAVENYFFQYLYFTLNRGWPVPYSAYVRSGLDYFFETGLPCYQWALILFAALCFILILFNAYRYEIGIFIKEILLRCVSNSESLIFCDILIDHFSEYLTEKDYFYLKRVYISELTSQCAARYRNRFSQLDLKYKNDYEDLVFEVEED